ncbi:MAG: POTRA domain-containing protein, partial [Planctomycetota bacterium]
MRSVLLAALAVLTGAALAPRAVAEPVGSAAPPLAISTAPAQESTTPQASGQAVDDRPVIRGIEVEGLTAHDPMKIAERLGLRIGQKIPRSIDAREKRLWDDFRILVVTNGYSFEEVQGGVIVHLRLFETPVVLDPKFVGNVHFDVDQLREWALLDERVEITVDAAERIEDRIRRAYQRQGYHFVEVDHVLGGEGARRRELIFEIREGPKVYVKKVEIEGNTVIPDEGILIWRKTLKKLARLGTKGRGLFAWWGHRFDEEVMEADRIALVQQYRDRGYLDAIVDAEMEFTADRSGVKVKFVVDEGEPYQVRSIGIRAVEFEDVEVFPGQSETRQREAELTIPEEELLQLLALKVGEPIQQTRVRVDQRRLLERYGEDGHIPLSRFENRAGSAGWRFLEPQLTFDYENHQVDVVYVLQQGRPFYLRHLEIAGNENTKDHVLRRRFAQMPGELVDTVKMQEGMRRVRATGFFDDQFARGQHPPPTLTYRAVEGEPDLVDAFVTVKEGRTINANLSGGVASDQGLVGIVSVSINNFDAQKLPRSWLGVFGEVYRKEAFNGDGETFGIDVSPGSEVSYWRLFYQHPDVFSRYFDPIGFVSEVQQRGRIFRSNDEERTFARFAVTRALGQGDVQLSAGVRWQTIEIDDFDVGGDLPRTLTRSEGRERFVGLTGSISANKLDNRRLPRSGWTARWTNTVYGEALGSDNNLWKSEASFDRYFHFSEDTTEAAPGIYMNFGAGLAVPFDGNKGSVNYGERFFFGGARFGRGLRFRGWGPYDGDFPLGGETYLRTTLEYRFPLYAQTVPGTSKRREVFRGSFFVDAGVLDPQAYELDFAERRATAGFALGLIEP